MNYISQFINQLKNGDKLHIKFPKIQEDYFENKWTEEIWEYKNNKIKIVYVGRDFTSEHGLSEANSFLRDYEREDAKVEIIDSHGLVIEPKEKEEDEEYKLYLKLKEKFELN